MVFICRKSIQLRLGEWYYPLLPGKSCLVFLPGKSLEQMSLAGYK